MDYITIFLTGSLSGPERVSPSVVFLTPPEKLVLEVRASGGYDFIVWNRVDDRSFKQDRTTELVNFHEIFVRHPTTTSEYGTYRPDYPIEGGETTILVVPTGMLLFYHIEAWIMLLTLRNNHMKGRGGGGGGNKFDSLLSNINHTVQPATKSC